MVTPEARREVVAYTREQFDVSERQACKIFGFARSMIRYRRRADRNEDLRKRLKELALKRKKWGCPLLFKALKREGWRVNHKRVERLYKAEGLALRRKKRGKKIVRERRKIASVTQPNRHWAMDFIQDSLWNGRQIRCLTIIDCGSRYSPAIEVGFSLTSSHVIAALNRLALTHGLPETITLDNGSEFTSDAFKKWAKDRNIDLHFIQPGKPMQNGFAESFNGTFRHECLDSHWFTSLADAKKRIENWRQQYNAERPHSSIQDRTPEEVEIDFFNRETNKLLDHKKG